MPLHAQSQAFLDSLIASDVPSWDQLPPDVSRNIFDGLTDLFGEGPQLPSVTDRLINDRIPVRVFRSSTSEPRPVVVYFHGGGWVVGSLDSHDAFCRRIAAESNCNVVAVDYRRAPEHPYPAAFDDCYEVTEYVAHQPDQFGAAPGDLAVAGDSAGGNLAAAVCIKAREEQGPAISLQLLIYPIIDHSLETLSYEDFAEGFGLTRDVMKWFWQQYVPGELPLNDAYLTPARAARLSGLPNAHIITAEYDVLRDEGESYAARLSKSGVTTTSRRYDGMLHGFVHFWNAYDDGVQAIADLSAVVQERFA